MSASGHQSASQPLPAKEAGLFRQVVKFYETKQYKKAIKAADQVLKKFPEHGETLSMKGLVVSNMGSDRKDEAYDLVRRGLKADLKSHVCWHVYGLLHRAAHDYREAIKCYLNALRLDKDNIQILRDLALLQIQTRDLPGFVETRQQLLVLKPNNRNHWISFAVAHHANRAHEMAAGVLSAYEGTLGEVAPSEAYEHSEMLLYKAVVLEEGGDLEGALKVIDGAEGKIKDITGAQELRASILARMPDRKAEAEAAYRALVASNPDHTRWHHALHEVLGLKAAPGEALSSEQVERLTALYQELGEAHPASSGCRRIPLDFLQGDAFVAAADAYVRKYLRKGVPSLFRDLRPLYSDPSKAEALGQLFESYSTSLAASGAFPPLAGSAEAGAESPQTRVWVLYYLAQHYDKLGATTRGLSLLAEALAHTPTLVELRTARAKLLRHAGDLQGAAHECETARRADLSDRYLNSMAMKALLRADEVEAAEKTAQLFLRDGDTSGTASLYDMQHMWYEVAAGAAHMRREEYGKALKQFHAVVKHFDDIHEDQFDFHSYCVRKTTLRAYVGMLRMEDKLYGHPFFARAAVGAVKVYLALLDKPSAAQQQEDEEKMLAAMSADERKKYKLKKKKEEKAKAKEAEEAAAAKEAAAKEAAAKADKKKGAAAERREKDPDPEGALLAATPDPLGAAAKLVAQLKANAPHVLDAQLVACEVYLRKGRLLLALSAAQRAAGIAGAAHPDVHRAVVRLAQKAAEPAAVPAHPTVAGLLSEGVSALLGGAKDVTEYNAQWVSQNAGQSLAHRLAGAEATLALGAADAKAKASDLILQGSPLKAKHDECVAALQLLEGPLAHTEGASKWRAACSEAFPYSRVFEGAQRLTLEPDYGFSTMVEAFGKLSF